MNKTISAVIVVFAGVALILLLAAIVYLLQMQSLRSELGLPLLTIAGVLVMIAFLALAAIAFALFDLDDKTQALALPEGSVRAVVALSLILLFATLSIYLYGDLSASGQIRSMTGVPKAQAPALVALLPKGSVIRVLDSKSADVDPTPAGISGSENAPFTILYQSAHNPVADDFARQLLVMIGTLVTAVSSFYFGSRVSASAQAAATTPPPPVIQTISPSTAAHGASADFEIAGSNLNGVMTAKISPANGNAIVATHLTSNLSVIKCTFDLTSAAPGAWTVIVTDAFGQEAKLAGALTMT